MVCSRRTVQVHPEHRRSPSAPLHIIEIAGTGGQDPPRQTA
jgi:hypothetical protein